MQHYGEEVPLEFLMHRLILPLSYYTVLSDSQSLSLPHTSMSDILHQVYSTFTIYTAGLFLLVQPHLFLMAFPS